MSRKIVLLGLAFAAILLLFFQSSIPAVVAQSSGLKVQYKAADTNVADNQFKPHFNIVNTGSSAVPLSELKIRYYFTKDNAAALQFNCDYAVVGCGNVSGTFVAITPVTNADTYFEVGFTAGAGSVAAGGSTGEIQTRNNHSDWSNFNEANDYSFNASMVTFTDSTKVALFRNGSLVWGVPPGVTATSTNTPTSTRTRTPTSTSTGTKTSTPTATKTLTPTSTSGIICDTVTVRVSPVTSPTTQTTQVINVTETGGGIPAYHIFARDAAGNLLTQASGNGNNAAAIPLNLIANATHYLTVTANAEVACRRTDGSIAGLTFVTAATTVDTNGNPLVIVQVPGGPSATPTKTMTPVITGT